MCVYACMYVKRKKYFACVQLCRAKLVWPDYIQSSGNTGKDCFRKNAEFSCSASECLSLYGPIRHFLRTLNLDRSEDASVRLTVRSLVLALNLLELCHSSMRGPISSDTLHKYVVDHLKAFKLAHGEGIRSAKTPLHAACRSIHARDRLSPKLLCVGEKAQGHQTLCQQSAHRKS